MGLRRIGHPHIYCVTIVKSIARDNLED
jgi:hypothetical protein